MKKTTNFGLAARTCLAAVLIFLLFYFELPPLNLRSKDFYQFLAQVILILLVVYGSKIIKDLYFRFQTIQGGGFSFKELKNLAKPFLFGVGAIALIFIFLILGDLIGHPFLHSGAYSSLIKVEEGDFSTDVAEISMSQIPVVDRASATALGNRKLGEMSELVSQFEIMTKYTQINYKGTPYRVTPLQYGDMIKWFMNHSSGLPAYVRVNMVTQETSLKWLDEGMKYSPSEYFFHNISRHLRMHYPTKIFDFQDLSFEVDEDGTPYWVAPVITYRIGIWSGKDISGAVLVNAETGESQYYSLSEIPAWVDQVFISDLIINQLDYYGMYQNGFINAYFGQKGVKQTTDGYNYIAIGDDVYLYTGMTSVTSDNSNTGFMLVNLRTKDAHYYAVPGATEYSAMGSAEGQVQQMKYSATFPILLNISDRPTYFLSLKDAAGLVKMYAFVDVEQYQIVGTGTTVKGAMANYATALGLDSSEPAGPGSVDEEPVLEADGETSGTIASITSAVVNGNTCYYFMLEGDDSVYTAFISVDPKLPFVKAGDQVSLEFATKASVKAVLKISF